MRGHGPSLIERERLVDNLRVKQTQRRPAEVFGTLDFDRLAHIDIGVSLVHNLVAEDFLDDVFEGDDPLEDVDGVAVGAVQHVAHEGHVRSTGLEFAQHFP